MENKLSSWFDDDGDDDNFGFKSSFHGNENLRDGGGISSSEVYRAALSFGRWGLQSVHPEKNKCIRMKQPSWYDMPNKLDEKKAKMMNNVSKT